MPSDDVLGHALKDVLPTDAFSELQGYIERAFSGATVSYERRERQLDGDARWMRITLFPDREVGGRIGGAFVVMNDIEDDIRVRDALKSQESQMRSFADNIPGPIAYLDRNLKYTFVNQAFANSVCKPQDEIYGKTPFQVMVSDVASFLRPILKRAQAGEHVEYERVGNTLQGNRRWLHGRIAPDLDAAGTVRGLYCTEYDIHDLKLTEQALAAREEQLRLFNDNIPEPIVYLSADRRYEFVNEAFLPLVGLARDEVLGKTTEEVLGPDLAGMMEPGRNRVFAGEAITYERAVIDANGRERWIRARCVPDLNFDGTVKGEYVVGHDITDLKQAQDTLATREGQLTAIINGVPAPVAYIDRDERCHYVNRAFLQFFGLTQEQVSAMRLRDVVGHGIYQSAQAMLTRAMEGESTAFDRLVPGANGMRRWMTIRVVPDASPSGEVHGAFVLMNDIHGLKQAQEALRDSEAALRLIMDNVPARVSYIDRDYRYRFLNRHNEEWLGQSRKELQGRQFAEVVGNERANQLGPLLDRVLGGETVSTEKQLAQPDGQERWESVHYAPHRDAEGNVVGIYAVHADIHDQKRNEDELKRANWMLSSHISNTPLAVLEWDRDFRLVRWSPQAENIFGWRSDEILGIPLSDSPLLHEDDREGFAGLVARLINGEEPRATGLTRNHRRDGETIWCEWYHSALLDDEGRIVSILSFVQDVSSRIQAEERLQYLATRDALTGLPNRLLLHERLTQAIAQAKRSGRRVGRAVHRPRPLQERERHAGPPHRRRAAEARDRGAVGRAARNRPARAPGRRRVHGDRRGLRRPRGARADRAEAARRDRAAVRDRRARDLRHVVDRHRRLSRRLRRPGGAAQARGRRDVPVEGPRPQHVPVHRREPGRAPAAPAHAGDLAADRARPTTRCACITSRSSGSRTARSSAPRRCCAGTIPSTATCRRRSSSRSPRSRASSTRSASGCCGRPRASASRGARRG